MDLHDERLIRKRSQVLVLSKREGEKELHLVPVRAPKETDHFAPVLIVPDEGLTSFVVTSTLTEDVDLDCRKVYHLRDSETKGLISRTLPSKVSYPYISLVRYL